MLMKGLPKHDKELQDILNSAEETMSQQPDEVGRPLVVVLWPSSSAENLITLEELRETLETLAEPSDDDADGKNKQVVLLAVDGTWRNARRMVAKLPSHVKRLDLDEQALRSMATRLYRKIWYPFCLHCGKEDLPETRIKNEHL